MIVCRCSRAGSYLRFYSTFVSSNVSPACSKQSLAVGIRNDSVLSDLELKDAFYCATHFFYLSAVVSAPVHVLCVYLISLLIPAFLFIRRNSRGRARSLSRDKLPARPYLPLSSPGLWRLCNLF